MGIKFAEKTGVSDGSMFVYVDQGSHHKVGIKFLPDAIITTNPRHRQRDLVILHEFCHYLVHTVMFNSKYSEEYINRMRVGDYPLVQRIELCVWRLSLSFYRGCLNDFRDYGDDCLVTYGIPVEARVEALHKPLTASRRAIVNFVKTQLWRGVKWKQ